MKFAEDKALKYVFFSVLSFCQKMITTLIPYMQVCIVDH